MRDEIAELVYPVIRTGIEIKQGLRSRPHHYQFTDARARLLGLLQGPVDPDLRGDIWGDSRAGGISEPFLGIRYALACWLDEIFIADSRWKDSWENSKLETALFGTTLRFDKFWEQAELSRFRPTLDALEVYYLCVMLGFRGRPRELTAWREETEHQIFDNGNRDYEPPPRLRIVPEVQPLHGKALMEKWLFLLTLIGLAFVPVLVFLFKPTN